jgi:hypothetical protein
MKNEDQAGMTPVGESMVAGVVEGRIKMEKAQ